MSERMSSFGRIIGGEPDQRKTIETFSEDRFDRQDLLKGEREKTPTEEVIIDLANEATDALRMHYGIEPFPVPSKNIHVIKMEEWGNGKESGRTNYVDQNILMVEWASRLLFAKEVLHELIHFKSMMIWELKDGDLDKKGLFLTEAPSPDFPEGRQTSVLDYRIGLRVRIRPEGKRNFDD